MNTCSMEIITRLGLEPRFVLPTEQLEPISQTSSRNILLAQIKMSEF